MFEIIQRILHCSIANGFELYLGFVFKISLLLVRILSVTSSEKQVMSNCHCHLVIICEGLRLKRKKYNWNNS